MFVTTIVLMEANYVGIFFTRTLILHIYAFNMFQVWHLSLICYSSLPLKYAPVEVRIPVKYAFFGKKFKVQDLLVEH